MMKPAHQHPMRRSALMIGAHIIWGAAAGLLMNKLTPKTLSALR
jgi:hypothetical protein